MVFKHGKRVTGSDVSGQAQYDSPLYGQYGEVLALAGQCRIILARRLVLDQPDRGLSNSRGRFQALFSIITKKKHKKQRSTCVFRGFAEVF